MTVFGRGLPYATISSRPVADARRVAKRPLQIISGEHGDASPSIFKHHRSDKSIMAFELDIVDRADP
jgi:hypothetical protein